MSRKEKLIKRFLALPKDFTYSELVAVFKICGFVEDNKGKTSGSRVRFHNSERAMGFMMHKPHPENIVMGNALKDALDFLKSNNYL